MVVHSISSQTSLRAMATYAELELAFKGDLVTAGHPEYEDAIKRWAANASRRAKVVAFVSCPQDVVLAIKYARESSLPLAVRGGGHNPAASSSSEGGIVIDLSRYLNRCRVDAHNKLAYVGGGALWESVDKAAIEHGLATVGGTVNHTGVGGLTLGGGYGWLSGQHGLTIDNLVEATMVVADGSILTASASQNSDLFWAIRGGGCNFGVVCEFVYRLHEQRATVYSGIMIFPPPLVEQVIEVTANWANKGLKRPEASILQAVTRGPPPEFSPCIVVIPFFNGTIEEGRAEFKDFLDLGPVDLTREVPYEEMNSLQNPSVQHGQGIYMRGVTQLVYEPETVHQVYTRMCELSTPELRVSMLFELFPLDKINEVSNNATAFNIRGSAQNVMCVVAWDDAGDGDVVRRDQETERGRQLGRQMTEVVANAEKAPDAAKTRAYGNYVGDEKLVAEHAQQVFGDNYPRLQQIKAKYDPDMVFSKWFTIVPA